MHETSWLLWAVVLFFQNISFTYVSRARNSGSLLRHVKAALFSNGIWIFSNMIMLGPLFAYLTGAHGLAAQAATGALYTVSTVSGGIFAHFWALKTEKGKSAVGASKLYAQITIAEHEQLKALLAVAPEWKQIIDKAAAQAKEARELAGQAYTCSIGQLPDSGIGATKIAGTTIKTGLAR